FVPFRNKSEGVFADRISGLAIYTAQFFLFGLLCICNLEKAQNKNKQKGSANPDTHIYVQVIVDLNDKNRHITVRGCYKQLLFAKRSRIFCNLHPQFKHTMSVLVNKQSRVVVQG